MGLFDSSNEKGKQDGEKGEKDIIRYQIDEDYKKGYDYGEGIKDGSEHQEDLLDAVDRSFTKSKEYNRGYDRGEKLYHGESASSEEYNFEETNKVEEPTTSGRGGCGGVWVWVWVWVCIIGLIFCAAIETQIRSCSSPNLIQTSSTSEPAQTALEIRKQRIEKSLEKYCQENMPPPPIDNFSYNKGPAFSYEYQYVFIREHIWARVGRFWMYGPGRIIHSTDNGNSWEIQWVREKTSLNSMIFLNEYEGIVGIDRDTIIKTSDGGKTWNNFFTLHNMPGVGIWWIQNYEIKDRQNITLVAGGDVNAAFVTKDGGNTWEHIIQHGRYYGSKDGVLRTSNGGKTWQGIYVKYK